MAVPFIFYLQSVNRPRASVQTINRLALLALFKFQFYHTCRAQLIAVKVSADGSLI